MQELKRMRQSVRRFIKNGGEGIQGVAAIEFAIMVASLATMMVCLADLGIGLYRKMQVQNASQVGAQYALLHGYSASSIANAVTAATNYAGITASPSPSQFCGCPSSTTITTISCSSNCGDGSTPGTYVSVSAQATYSTIISYPMLPRNFTLTGQSTVRIQ
jgi:Flp pilus assembly protein TadG